MLGEIVEIGANLDWGAGPAFEMAAEMAGLPEQASPAVLPAEPKKSRPAALAALEPRDIPAVVSPDEAAEFLEPGGGLARLQPGYEHRSQQVRMTRAVAEALSTGKHLLVEAGTGTGKSMAYLIPAFLWAARNGRRVVVSTNTINLQDQLIRKDIPRLQQLLGGELRAAVLKGRSNYLCPARFEALRRLRPRTTEEMRVLAKVMVWLARGGTGERIDLSLGGPGEMMAWNRISAESEECSLDACLERTGGACAFYAARTQAEASHVLIVNHALLMADIQSGNRVLPEFRHLIIDEGHHLEAATTSGMSVPASSEGDLARTLRDLVGAPNALLPEAFGPRPPLDGRRRGRGRLAKSTQALEATVPASCRKRWSAVFIHLAEFLAGLHGEEAATSYNLQIRIVPALARCRAWSAVEVAWDETRPLLTGIADGLADLADTLAGFGDGGSTSAVDVAGALRTSLRSLREIGPSSVERFVSKPDPGTIYWAAPPVRPAPRFGRMPPRWRSDRSSNVTCGTRRTRSS